MGPFDVLIVTAVQDEYEAVLAVETGAAPGSKWEEHPASTGLAVALRDFTVEGGTLRVGVTQALGMGGANAVMAAAELIGPHEVQCLAMCGVCAGKRGDVELGDVIIADRVWQYDTGKRKATTPKRKRTVKVQTDVDMYRLHPPAWKQAAERFQIDRDALWLAQRPRSYEAQGDWILERVLRAPHQLHGAESETKCADFDKAIERLWKKGLLVDGMRELTEAGKKHIERVLLKHKDNLPEPKQIEVRVGPIASGNMVIADGEVFAMLSDTVRKVLGVEMEAAAIGALAHMKQVPYSVVMKAVMDHADEDKSDNFKDFAAQASAEVLLAFVRQQVPPRGAEEDPILGPGTSKLPKPASPAMLLNARHEVVPFRGRDALLDEMRVWCESEDVVRARLIHAAGGMGKTRLAIELCKQMRARGWRAGFLKEGNRLVELMESTQRALVVIDYAESRPELRAMISELAGSVSKNGPRVRLLLLARNADEWWREMLRRDAAVGDLLGVEEPMELPAAQVEKEQIFRDAVGAFAKETGKTALDAAAPDLTDEKYERVLYVHAAALAKLEGDEVAADTLMDHTLNHEERFWSRALQELGPRAERGAVLTMQKAVAALTLKGGGGEIELRGLVEANDVLAMLLRDLYPARAPKWVAGLEPDLLGEAMVLRVLRKMGAGAEAYLDRVFDGASKEAVRTGFEVLGRLSEEHEEAAGWIARVLGGDVNGRVMEAFAAAMTVGERTAHAKLGMELAKALMGGGTVGLAERLAKDLVEAEETVSLLEVGRWTRAKLLDALPDNAVEERATLLHQLSVWQAALGERDAALANAQEAVMILRKLIDTSPDTQLPALALCINNLASRHGALGQRELALASMQECAGIYTRLADENPEEFLGLLAMALNNLGSWQSELGQHDAALLSLQRVVAAWREFAEVMPEQFEHSLGMSLSNLAVALTGLGHHEAALDAVREAADIFRRLVRVRPEAHLRNFTRSLINQAQAENELGNLQAALAAALEAVDTCRKLARTRPHAFGPELAAACNNLSTTQSVLGQSGEALETAREALETIWPFFLGHPAAFAADTRGCLQNLGRRLDALGLPPLELLERMHIFNTRFAAALEIAPSP